MAKKRSIRRYGAAGAGHVLFGRELAAKLQGAKWSAGMTVKKERYIDWLAGLLAVTQALKTANVDRERKQITVGALKVSLVDGKPIVVITSEGGERRVPLPETKEYILRRALETVLSANIDTATQRQVLSRAIVSMLSGLFHTDINLYRDVVTAITGMNFDEIVRNIQNASNADIADALRSLTEAGVVEAIATGKVPEEAVAAAIMQIIGGAAPAPARRVAPATA